MRARNGFSHLVAGVVVVATAAGAAGQAGQVRSAIPQKPDDRAIVHVLNRLGFGAAPGDVERVRTIGLTTYIDQQLQPDKIDDSGMATRLTAFETLSKSTQEMAQHYYMPAQMARRELQRQQAAQEPASSDPAMTGPPQNDAARRSALRDMMTPEQAEAVRMERQALTELMQAKILRAAYSDRQLEEVMVDFWFNHFNVFSGKARYGVYLTEYERDAIRPHVLGNVPRVAAGDGREPRDALLSRQLAERRARGRAHGRSAYPERSCDPAQPEPDGRAARRNESARSDRQAAHARRPPTGSAEPADRPQRELRTRADGAPHARRRRRLHAEGRAGGRARVHGLDDRQSAGRAAASGSSRGCTTTARRSSSATRSSPAAARSDGERVLDILATHPSTARLHRDQAGAAVRRRRRRRRRSSSARRAAFRDTDGNIREVVRTIVTSPEFFAADAYRAKVKTPFEFVVSAVRATRRRRARTRCRSCRPCASSACRSTGCQPPTGYADTRRRVGQHRARCSTG